jgi:hypothetical protein
MSKLVFLVVPVNGNKYFDVSVKFSAYVFTVLFVVVNVLAFRVDSTDPRTSTAGDVGLLTVV